MAPSAASGNGHGEKANSFAGLLQSLSAVYESQEDRIRELSDENAVLLVRLKKGNFGGGDHAGFVGPEARILAIKNTKPEFPYEHLRELGDPAVATQSSQVSFGPVFTVDVDGVQKESTVDSNYLASANSSLGKRQESDGMSYVKDASFRRWLVPDLWPEWVAKDCTSRRIMTRSSHSTMCDQYTVEDFTGQAMSVTASCHQRFILSPNSLCRLAWDFLSALMVCYDVIAIPLLLIRLGDPSHEDSGQMSGGHSFTSIMDWITLAFWTLDMPCSFLTGFHDEGIVEMRALVIAVKYFRTWFFFDFFILLIEWGSVVAENSRSIQFLGFLRIGKTARFLRIARTVRLLRFVRVHKLFGETMEVLNSQGARAALSIQLAFAFIFVVSHYLACGWFLTGLLGRDFGEPNWLDMNNMEERQETYVYFTALHWSLTQFTPASMEIRPYNLGERVYSICCLMFALVAFSSFLGSISATITELRNHSKDASQQEFVLRTYLNRNNVSHSLSRKIWIFLNQNHFKHQKRSPKGAIPTLKLLPPHLHNALYQELYGPYITRAPFFFQYMAFCREGLVDVCSSGITEQTLMRGESLFVEGRVAQSMYFTASGFMLYDHPQTTCLVGTGAWISEAALWVQWAHVATLYADTSCEVIQLDSAKFRSVVGVFKHSLAFVRVYAHLFQEYLKELGATEMTDLMTDVAGLQNVTRKAWQEVTCSADKNLFKEMTNLEFPGADHHHSFGRKFIRRFGAYRKSKSFAHSDSYKKNDSWKKSDSHQSQQQRGVML